MKFLLIVDDYLPHSIKVAAKMMHELALELTSNGHEVTVLTPAVSQRKSLKIEKVDEIEVLFFKHGEIKNVGKVKRAINELLLSFSAWKAGASYFKKRNYDGIIYYSPSIFWSIIVARLKKLWGCESYLILRDIFPQWTIDNGILKENSLKHKYFKYFEKINYQSADKIGVMSLSNLNYFKEKGVNVEKFEILFNWSKKVEVKPHDNFHRKKLGLEDKIVLFYGGNIGQAQHMINLVRLAINLKEDGNIHFLFVGKGDEVDLILREKKKHGLDNITYLEAVDQETYFEMLNEFDIGLFSLHPGHKTHNFPGKLLGYMAYSKPILGCANIGNDLKEIINEAKAGYVVNSEDSNGLLTAAIALVESKSLRRELGQNGRVLLNEQFSIQSAAAQIQNSFQREQ